MTPSKAKAKRSPRNEFLKFMTNLGKFIQRLENK